MVDTLSTEELDDNAYHSHDTANDPKSFGNFGFGPALGLEMMMNGGREKNFFAAAQFFA